MAKDGPDAADIWVMCPSCSEIIGLVGTELHHGRGQAIVHKGTVGSFVCHVCQSGYWIKARLEPFPTVDDVLELAQGQPAAIRGDHD